MSADAPAGRLTLKEQITDLLREQGYDFVTACEEYERARVRGVFTEPGKIRVGALTVTLGQGHHPARTTS